MAKKSCSVLFLCCINLRFGRRHQPDSFTLLLSF
jgi:hypothetical protein